MCSRDERCSMLQVAADRSRGRIKANMPPQPSTRTPYTDYFAYVYAGIVFIGGIIGFIKAGSLTSIGIGTVTGTLLGIGARQVSANPRHFSLLLILSGALMVVMGTRYSQSGKVMPAGLITLISAISFLRYGIRLASN
ncbi:uncharacterized protein SPPG_08545 [Spizellomyces punctatus DAOM BR117]|uniref:Transmembrane protein 14C n=1 Tax=Spizellomyces punctatus (strain DAOM BR117) TaxID=645134 RepID=A0A0L0H4N6_SPIPD|nr:uncharacterized protein SPPG_08545 [Spizellomyces punctatus DAOM BR117]KNC96157.1 hypothetical protein SPPG_08545 [Spizellomyces punctatus DAOM BR117]|eukprot:XP_016604197.1 hypothetical protein SPPG_08545 [Spizellomyces punctatus DAOM BR117]